MRTSRRVWWASAGTRSGTECTRPERSPRDPDRTSPAGSSPSHTQSQGAPPMHPRPRHRSNRRTGSEGTPRVSVDRPARPRCHRGRLRRPAPDRGARIPRRTLPQERRHIRLELLSARACPHTPQGRGPRRGRSRRLPRRTRAARYESSSLPCLLDHSRTPNRAIWSCGTSLYDLRRRLANARCLVRMDEGACVSGAGPIDKSEVW
jgi:hypothetical protein